MGDTKTFTVVAVYCDFDPRAAEPTLVECPKAPRTRPGCKITTKQEFGCTIFTVKCNRFARAAKCAKVEEPIPRPGCHNISDKDAAGCPTWEEQCIHVAPPHQVEEIAIIRETRAAKGKKPCPAVKIPKAPKGCKLETGKDVDGCTTWIIGCNGS